MFALIPRESYAVMPWKNGGGVTYEVAADISPRAGWRLSIATIERDGPFSDFTGFDRTILALDAGAVTLHFSDDGSSVPLMRLQPFRFSGERPVSASLGGGSVRDYNVMTKRESFAHDMAILVAAAAEANDSGIRRWTMDDRTFGFALVLEGEILEPVRTRTGDALRLDGAAHLDLRSRPGTNLAIVTIRAL